MLIENYAGTGENKPKWNHKQNSSSQHDAE
ncbi:hypothetical protein Pan14r_49530 [Crateriforma conspicua]|uniref:Uncharacterized protein n=1 Tax=Crateriforma conspicua TaxID=2527996 RepID=A0A5C5YCX9_9PLAN|nr:hypothetical protein Pan14r_49530 [Crateriforma conspicua]